MRLKSHRSISSKCSKLVLLEKDDAVTAGPVSQARGGIGYMGEDSRKEKPLFAQKGEPANTSTEGYRNTLYSKKKRRGIPKTGIINKIQGFIENIEDMTNENQDFRRVVYTGRHSQLVLMKLLPGEEIGEEVHKEIDQFFRVDSGEGVALVGDKQYEISDGSGIVVPAGINHNITNTSKYEDLKLYTIYSPPEHKDKTIRRTKKEAESQKEHFDGTTTE
jgi:mannose-6-phosphate isomerase-like protein (cupin superfamily)